MSALVVLNGDSVVVPWNWNASGKEAISGPMLLNQLQSKVFLPGNLYGYEIDEKGLLIFDREAGFVCIAGWITLYD